MEAVQESIPGNGCLRSVLPIQGLVHLPGYYIIIYMNKAMEIVECFTFYFYVASMLSALLSSDL